MCYNKWQGLWKIIHDKKWNKTTESINDFHTGIITDRRTKLQAQLHSNNGTFSPHTDFIFQLIDTWHIFFLLSLYLFFFFCCTRQTSQSKQAHQLFFLTPAHIHHSWAHLFAISSSFTNNTRMCIHTHVIKPTLRHYSTLLDAIINSIVWFSLLPVPQMSFNVSSSLSFKNKRRTSMLSILMFVINPTCTH